ncbi:MAG: response regulator [bacterium]|nr:response regulator [bacterium]
MKILLADDEPDILLLYKQMLEGSGYQVVAACNGEEALVEIGVQRFDLVVLDLHMPRVDGFEVLEELKQQAWEVPVIVMTGYYSDEAIAKRMHGMKVEEVLRKPVMITTLMNAVNRSLGKK